MTGDFRALADLLSDEPQATIDRFWSGVSQPADSDCWEWTRGKNSSGYGRISIAYKNRLTHRVSYTLMVGPIPDGLTLDHLCRNKICVNPDHLEPVPSLVNVRRAKPHLLDRDTCANGHAITPDSVYVFKSGKSSCKQCSSDKQKARVRSGAVAAAKARRLARKAAAA